MLALTTAGRAEHDVLPPAAGDGPAPRPWHRSSAEAATLRDQARGAPRGPRALAGRRWPPSSRPRRPPAIEATEPRRCWPCATRSRPGSTRPERDRRCSIAWSTSARPRPTTRTARSPTRLRRRLPRGRDRPGGLPPAEAGAKIKARPPSVALALAAALDDWAAIRRAKRQDAAGAARLSAAARVADPDPWRNELRDRPRSTRHGGPADRLAGPGQVGEVRRAGPVSLHLLGDRPERVPAITTLAESVLRTAQQRHPGDVWVNYDLGRCWSSGRARDEAIRFYTAARAIRPETAHELAHCLEKRGESDEAIAVLPRPGAPAPGNGPRTSAAWQLLKASEGVARRPTRASCDARRRHA